MATGYQQGQTGSKAVAGSAACGKLGADKTDLQAVHIHKKPCSPPLHRLSPFTCISVRVTDRTDLKNTCFTVVSPVCGQTMKTENLGWRSLTKLPGRKLKRGTVKNPDTAKFGHCRKPCFLYYIPS